MFLIGAWKLLLLQLAEAIVRGSKFDVQAVFPHLVNVTVTSGLILATSTVGIVWSFW